MGTSRIARKLGGEQEVATGGLGQGLGIAPVQLCRCLGALLRVAKAAAAAAAVVGLGVELRHTPS